MPKVMNSFGCPTAACILCQQMHTPLDAQPWHLSGPCQQASGTCLVGGRGLWLLSFLLLWSADLALDPSLMGLPAAGRQRSADRARGYCRIALSTASCTASPPCLRHDPHQLAAAVSQTQGAACAVLGKCSPRAESTCAQLSL